MRILVALAVAVAMLPGCGATSTPITEQAGRRLGERLDTVSVAVAVEDAAAARKGLRAFRAELARLSGAGEVTAQRAAELDAALDDVAALLDQLPEPPGGAGDETPAAEPDPAPPPPRTDQGKGKGKGQKHGDDEKHEEEKDEKEDKDEKGKDDD